MKSGIVVFIGNPFREKIMGRANNRKDHIIETVGNYYGVNLRKLTRKREIAFPRQVAMAMLYDIYQMGVVDIGREFGKSHGTAINAIKMVRAICDTSPETKRQIDEIKSMLQ
jgi:chromosomal replication initiator protein